MYKHSVIAFISGFLILLMLFLAGGILYTVVGFELGYSTMDLNLFGLTIFNALVSNDSFTTEFGPGLFVIATLGGLLNFGLAKYLKNK